MDELITILLVEDSPIHAEMIQDALNGGSLRLQVRVASSLAEARDFLATAHPDLLLVDYLLADGKGTDLLPEDPEQILWPVVLLTGQSDEHVAVEAIKRGALDYVVKTPAMLELMPRIIERSRREWGHIVARRQAAQRAIGFGQLLDASLHEIYTFDAETLRFVQVNRGARQNLGYSMEELRSLTPLDIKPDVTHEFLTALLQPLRDGTTEMVTFCSSHRRRDGSCYPVEVHLQLLSLESRPVFVAMLLDISDRKRAEEALRDSEARFRSIFEAAAAGMVITSPEGSFIQANPAFVKFIGYSEPELLGMSVIDVTHPADRGWTEEYYQRLRQEQGQAIHTEKRYLRKDGTLFWGHTSVACVLGSEHTLAYCVGLVQDITERKRMEEKLQALNRELDCFVYTVSHDLRTQLTPIVGYAQFLQSAYADRLDAQGLECLGEIERQGLFMADMIDDLLTLAKMGVLELPDEPFDVAPVVGTLLKIMSPQIVEAGAEVRVEALPRVRLPETLLRQIFDNLIGNAIRYAGCDGSPIEVGGQRHGDRVRLFVRDHGPGIQAREKEKIFDVFFRGSSGKGRRGTGIGLATVKKIARIYHGRVWVEDTPGGGATFWVELVG